jgi:hypothetical protein
VRASVTPPGFLTGPQSAGPDRIQRPTVADLDRSAGPLGPTPNRPRLPGNVIPYRHAPRILLTDPFNCLTCVGQKRPTILGGVRHHKCLAQRNLEPAISVSARVTCELATPQQLARVNNFPDLRSWYWRAITGLGTGDPADSPVKIAAPGARRHHVSTPSPTGKEKRAC